MNNRIDDILTLIDDALADSDWLRDRSTDQCNCDSDTAWRLGIPCPVH